MTHMASEVDGGVVAQVGVVLVPALVSLAPKPGAEFSGAVRL